MKKLLYIFGTRPEAIKLAPLIIQCKKDKAFDVKVCVTAQHRGMLDQVLGFFEISADYDLNLMKPGQTLFDITANGLKSLQHVIKSFSPDIVIVQGDTTTAFIGALSAYYFQIKVAHVEAGLRSGNKYSPFPEEINRRLAGVIADFHFAPTQRAVENLNHEGIFQNVFLVGNTVVDALLAKLDNVKEDNSIEKKFNFLDKTGKMILITGHRRESFGEGFQNICDAIRLLADKFKNFQFIYPVHLNPNVQKPVKTILKGLPNVFLIEPVDYPSMIWLMNRSYFILTDSGGIQEEAPTLGKPVLVMRNVTERMEGIEAGTAKLVGTKKEDIIKYATDLMINEDEYSKMANASNPYGDGTACLQIVKILKDFL